MYLFVCLEEVDLCIGTLAGDFLMPSILSSLDKGLTIVIESTYYLKYKSFSPINS